MTPPRMYTEGQNETKVCAKSTKLCGEIMVMMIRLEEEKEHQQGVHNMCTFFLLLLLMSFFAYVYIKHTINTSDVYAGYALKRMMNSTC